MLLAFVGRSTASVCAPFYNGFVTSARVLRRIRAVWLDSPSWLVCARLGEVSGGFTHCATLMTQQQVITGPTTQPHGTIVTRSIEVLSPWWAAISSGKFFTWWTAAVSFVIAITVLGAYVSADDIPTYLIGTGASALVWIVQAICILPVAYAERRIPDPGVRAALVLSAIIVAAIARPFLNDFTYRLFVPDAEAGNYTQRVLTNIAVWILMLSIVAVATSSYARAKDMNARLQTALAELNGAGPRVAAFDTQARAALVDSVNRVRAGLAALHGRMLTFDDVRDFGQLVRAESHTLEDASRGPLAAGPSSRTVTVPERSRSFLERLRPPPMFIVTAVYLFTTQPYLLSGLPLWLALVGDALTIAVGLAVDLLCRVVRWRTKRTRGLAVIIGWSVAGAVYSGLAIALHPPSGLVALVPLFGFPSLAIVSALSADAIRRSKVQSRRLTDAVAQTAEQLAARTADARDLLQVAGDALHGRVQGACVVFAAALDERDSTVDETAAFSTRVDAALEEVLHPAVDDATTEHDLSDLLETWSHVLTVKSAVDDASRAALRDAEVSRRVVGIVNEGFVNAVKHAGVHQAHLDLRVDAARSRVRVRVITGGSIPGGRAKPGRGIARLGEAARLVQRGSTVMLEASVPIETEEWKRAWGSV